VFIFGGLVLVAVFGAGIYHKMYIDGFGIGSGIVIIKRIIRTNESKATKPARGSLSTKGSPRFNVYLIPVSVQ